MSNRENYIDGVRIYSDNFEDENNKASKKVTTYKKVEATTTTTRKCNFTGRHLIARV